MLEVPDVDFIWPCGVVVLLCFIDACTCVVVSVRLVVCSVSVFLSMCLFVLCVLCLTLLVNCLLNTFAICVGEVNIFSLKVMVLFLGCVGLLLAKVCATHHHHRSFLPAELTVNEYCIHHISASFVSPHLPRYYLKKNIVLHDFPHPINNSE